MKTSSNAVLAVAFDVHYPTNTVFAGFGRVMNPDNTIDDGWETFVKLNSDYSQIEIFWLDSSLA